MEFIKENFSFVIGLIIFFVIISLIIVVIKKIKRTVRHGISQINMAAQTINNAADIAKAISLAAEDEKIAPKSVGGATSVYLKKIQKDFPGFHNQDAEAAIRTFIIEYLDIMYGNKNTFEKSKINKNILLNIEKESKKTVSNIKFNGIAIYNYDKTSDYATITYRCSFGYDLNGKRQEVRYDIDYTLQLLDNNIAQKSIICPNCGGILSTKDNNECPYCGTKIIIDTIMNWFITEATKNL